MNALRYFERHIEEIIITIITAVMLIALFLQVVFRFAIDMPLAWTEELSINLLPWLCYFGSSLAVRERKHLRIDIITNFLPFKAQKVFDVISDICFFIFSLFVIYYTTILTADIFRKGITTAVLQWPKWIVYIGVPLAFILTAYRLIIDLVRISKELKEYEVGMAKQR